MRAVLIFKLIRHLVRQIFRVMFAQNWLLTARARLALSSVNDLRSHSSPGGHRFESIPATNFQQKSAHWPPPCSPTICRRDEVSLDGVERILIPPFGGSNPPAPATKLSLYLRHLAQPLNFGCQSAAGPANCLRAAFCASAL